ncbi:MAG: hypothetical protein ACXVCM_14255 [Ktedonobacteraceae bacterium]
MTSWQGTQLANARFVTDYNAQPRWVLSPRDDNRLSPGSSARPEDQQTAHYRAVVSDFLCDTLPPPIRSAGLREFWRWKLYGAEALARHPTVISLSQTLLYASA